MLRTRSLNLVRLFIYINLFVFVLWWVYGADSSFMTKNFLVSWSLIEEGRWWVLITSVFSHNMIFHILINMIVLKDFGGLLENLLGSKFFLGFYFLAGVVSSLCHALVSAFILGAPDLPALGASGAISGLVLLFSLMFPRRKILFFGIIPIPALLGAILFVSLDLWGLSAQAEGGGLPIGHGAHLGGALTGILAYFLWVRPRLREISFHK